jgi:hypothetical protein
VTIRRASETFAAHHLHPLKIVERVAGAAIVSMLKNPAGRLRAGRKKQEGRRDGGRCVASVHLKLSEKEI